MHFCCRLEDSIDNQAFLASLENAHVHFEIRHDGQLQSLWLEDKHQLEGVSGAYAQYIHSASLQLVPRNMKSVPITTTILCLSIFVALVTGLGTQGREWFYIAELQFYPRGWFLHEWPEQVWFSVSPIFLHFSIEHIVFNCISFWYLGAQLERRLGWRMFVLLVLGTALTGNYGQLLSSGPLFGGLSGVVYGLIVFAGLYHWLIRTLYIPVALFVLAGAWLLLGYTPLFELIGLGSMANAAHLFGAIGGATVFALWMGATKEVKNHEY